MKCLIDVRNTLQQLLQKEEHSATSIFMSILLEHHKHILYETK
jgi:hypothetical protein